jgi:hypothetical protein
MQITWNKITGPGSLVTTGTTTNLVGWFYYGWFYPPGWFNYSGIDTTEGSTINWTEVF